MSERAQAGRAAEQRALDYLEAQGLRLRARNYRCRWGEIDLVMETGEGIVFVEVRYRRHAGYGGAAGSVDRRKQARLVRAAGTYLARERLCERPARFDVLAIDTDGDIDWIPDAFEA
ncbi:MAG: YraN family protein [Halofilum sp. (in: g-proteobacteria)]|nr:YraN family protein [Halofilum sp. (in: g-proteobacteria)]